MRTLLMLPALAAAAGGSACAPLAMAGATRVGMLAVQERTIGEGLDDAAGSNDLKMKLMRADSKAYARVDVELAAGKLLLSGTVPTEGHKQEAERLAWMVRQVQAVANELDVGAQKTTAESLKDAQITSLVRTRMINDPFVRGIDFNIETFRGTVYLMGVARSEQEIQRAAELASTIGGVKRVVSYVEADPWRGRALPVSGTLAQAEAAPIERGAMK